MREIEEYLTIKGNLKKRKKTTKLNCLSMNKKQKKVKTEEQL
jgi:hypothetical protein